MWSRINRVFVFNVSRIKQFKAYYLGPGINRIEFIAKNKLQGMLLRQQHD